MYVMAIHVYLNSRGSCRRQCLIVLAGVASEPFLDLRSDA